MTRRTPAPGSVTEATCTRCQILKPAAAFYANPLTRKGLHSRCIECMKDVGALRREVPKTTAAEATCNVCGWLKPSSEFHVNRRRFNGLTNRCRACAQDYYQAKRRGIIEYQRQHRWEDARVRMASDARRSDRRHGRESDIKAKDIVIPRACPVTGKPIYHGYGVRMAWSPCLERIDKSRGFVKGNWRVVSWEAVEASGMAQYVGLFL